jgi:hypothetical protein
MSSNYQQNLPGLLQSDQQPLSKLEIKKFMQVKIFRPAKLASKRATKTRAGKESTQRAS